MKVPFFSDYWYYFRLLWKYASKNLAVAVFISVLVAALDGIGIVMILPILEKDNQVSSDSGLSQWFDSLGFFDLNFKLLLVVVLGVFLLKGILKFLASWIMGLIIKDLTKSLKFNLLNRYWKMDMKEFVKKDSGHFTNLLTIQIEDFIAFFTNFNTFSGLLFNVIVYIFLAFLLDWKVSLLAVSIGGVGVILLKRFATETRKISIGISDENSVLNNLLIQAIHYFKYLRSTGSMKPLLNEVSKSVDRLALMKYRSHVIQGISTSGSEPLVVSFLLLLMFLQVVIMGNSLAALMVTLLLFYRTMNSLFLAQAAWQLSMVRAGSAERVDEEYLQVRYHEESSGAKDVSSFKEIVISNLSFSYGDREVFSNLNLNISKNESVALVGPSGVGKSTLVDLLTLNLKPTSGNIKIDGVDSADLNINTWRRNIGFVTQDVAIFNDTVANNISTWEGDYSSSLTIQQKVKHAAESAFCDEFINGMADGYLSEIGDRGVRLSGGQKQRLSIARELYKEPNLLILDEATSALDESSEKFIQKSIDNLKGELTVIIIAHRLSTIKNVDKIFVLGKSGKVEHVGTYEELSTSGLIGAELDVQ